MMSQASTLDALKDEFISMMRTKGVCRFGSFTLKSGRVSPYFFNLGLLSSGTSLRCLGEFFARKIIDSGLEFDVLFGPAYKGIPLATATAVALSQHYGLDIPVLYNRKEAKNHGEGGELIGNLEELNSRQVCRILLIDDVLTGGTAVREACEAVKGLPNAKITGIIIGLDREEKQATTDTIIASEKLQKAFGITVYSLVTFSDIVHYVKKMSPSEPLCPALSNTELLEAMEGYQKVYGTPETLEL